MSCFIILFARTNNARHHNLLVHVSNTNRTAGKYFRPKTILPTCIHDNKEDRHANMHFIKHTRQIRKKSDVES